MQGFAKKGLFLTAVASGLLVGGSGFAYADSSATGSTSNEDGSLSGNTAEAPIDAPIQVCGDTANGIAALDEAKDDDCTDSTDLDATATADTKDIEGSGSGNIAEVPVNIPTEVCGDTVNGGALLDPAKDDNCTEGGNGAGLSATATGTASHEEGTLTGNVILAPVNAPIEACGDTVTVIGGLNEAKKDKCSEG